MSQMDVSRRKSSVRSALCSRPCIAARKPQLQTQDDFVLCPRWKVLRAGSSSFKVPETSERGLDSASSPLLSVSSNISQLGQDSVGITSPSHLPSNSKIAASVRRAAAAGSRCPFWAFSRDYLKSNQVVFCVST